MTASTYLAATLILPLIFAIVCHEVAHGAMARLLGDTTALEQGRLTLNPLAHVDPVGTVILPGILALSHLPIFGWAKPVPVNPWRLRDPRRDMMLVGAAGPGCNLVMGLIAAVGLGLMTRVFGPATGLTGLAAFTSDNLGNFLEANLFLALFNLLPIPPFDGSHILQGLLPEGAARAYARLRRHAMALVLLVVVILPWLLGFSLVEKVVMPPFNWLLGQYLDLAAMIAGIR